ncbi:hypothetical protein P7C70_g4285, partial [Phenoliferia sp. Uapishka_3]
MSLSEALDWQRRAQESEVKAIRLEGLLRDHKSDARKADVLLQASRQELKTERMQATQAKADHSREKSALMKEISVLRQNKGTLTKELDAAFAQIQKEERTKNETQKELGKIRGFLSLADAGDVSRVISSPQAVDELAFQLSELASISHRTEDTVMLKRIFAHAELKFVSPFLVHVLSSTRRPLAAEYLFPVFKIIINFAVAKILRSFHPPHSPEESKRLFDARDNLTRTEPRGVARWRAMTYSAFESIPYKTHAEDWLDGALKFYLSHLGITFPDLDHPESTLLLKAVFIETIRYQKLVRQEYLSCEFEYTYPDPHVPLDGTSMQDESVTTKEPKGRRAANETVAVIATMSFGLRQKKWKDREGGLEVEENYLSKARVLTTKFMT